MRTTEIETSSVADTSGTQRLRSDLRTAFQAFPRTCLLHLRGNLDRLQPGTWHNHDGSKGCVFYLLSELLPERITTIHSLAKHFPKDAASDGTDGMPARLVLRAFDGYRQHDRVDEAARERYDGVVLDHELVKQELDAVISAGQPDNGPALSEAKLRWDFRLALG